tara:strand:+ start:496 stop:639 length:144 start_codon:yes stop_codon:yes gene_type:complete
MFKFLKKFFAVELQSAKQPLKYREYQYTLSELERRLNAEVQGYGTRY